MSRGLTFMVIVILLINSLERTIKVKLIMTSHKSKLRRLILNVNPSMDSPNRRTQTNESMQLLLISMVGFMFMVWEILILQSLPMMEN